MSKKSPSQLIEERMSEMPADMMYGDEGMEYKYSCMDTGMMFETYGDQAMYSPYTGSMNISMMEMEGVKEQDFQVMTDIPANQKDPMTQTPASPNPVPAGAAPKSGPDAPWLNQPWAGNPAPDQQGVIGKDQSSVADRGFVPYPQQSLEPGNVPKHVTKQPGERTDSAPAGSK